MSLRQEARLLGCALQFLTRLPSPRFATFDPDWIARSTRYFPLVGQLVGVLCAMVWLAARQVWPPLPAATLSVCAGVLITGGFHEDGLADTADGLGGGQTPAERLSIMKDSRIGTFGALALGLVLVLRIALLSGLSPVAGAIGLVVANGGARAAAVVMMTLLPDAGRSETAKVPRPSVPVCRWEASVALLLGAWPLLLLDWSRVALGVVLAGAFSLAVGGLARRLIGGVTGDVLGAVEQVSEVGLLMGAAAWVAR